MGPVTRGLIFMTVTGILRPSNEPGARNPSPGAEKMLRGDIFRRI